MNRVFAAFLFSGLSMLMVSLGARAESNIKAKQDNKGGDGMARCIYKPQADQQSSSLPTEAIGVRFSVERNNNNEISVDILSLNDGLQPKKLIGHAEMAAASEGKKSLASLTLAEDSPFDFGITTADTAATGNEGRISAVITTMTTFTGAVYAEVPVSCRIAVDGGKKQTELTSP